MFHHLLANLVLLLHLTFVLFVLLGGLLALKWRRAMWLHLPAVVWGAVVEFNGWICPLTPMENWLRARGGGQGYEGDFLEHYMLALLYPDGLTRATQAVLGLIVLVVNLAVYGWLWRRSRYPVETPQRITRVGGAWLFPCPAGHLTTSLAAVAFVFLLAVTLVIPGARAARLLVLILLIRRRRRG